MTTEKLDRLTNAFSVCEEFCYYATMTAADPVSIVIFVHNKWRSELERIVRGCGFRFSRIKPWGPFRIITLVDSYR
jgi:hypothetical protein